MYPYYIAVNTETLESHVRRSASSVMLWLLGPMEQTL